MIKNRSSAGTIGFVLLTGAAILLVCDKRFTVNAFTDGGIGFVSADLNFIQGTIVRGLYMVLAL